MVVTQYQVVLVNLDPTVGSEVKKTRPCLVISPDVMNRQLNTIIVAPMTTTSKAYLSRIEVRSGGKTGWVMIDQLRTIDKARIVKILGSLAARETVLIKQVIRELLIDL